MLNQPPRGKIKILLADDHVVVRVGLATAIRSEPDMEIIAEKSNGKDAIEAYEQLRPDVVILDLRMHGLSGIETLKALHEKFPDVRAVMFSNYASGEEVYQAIKAGALGFVLKEMDLERLFEAIRRAMVREQYIPMELAARVGERTMAQLSDRECDVLRFLAEGKSNKEIGAQLHIAESTVKIHLSNVFLKLGAADRTQAVVIAVKRGILQLD
jgi:DNA-binding NarL/FixJ family response regulator